MTTSHVATWAALAFFPAAMVFAGLMDVLTMKIRNHLVLAMVLAYAVLAPLAGLSLPDVGLSVAIAAGVFVAGFSLFSMGWIGGGDAKLATAAVLWLGAAHAIPWLLYTALIGGLVTLAVLAYRRVPLSYAPQLPEWLQRLHSPHCGVPYGAAMAPAALLVFPNTPWMAAIL